VAAAGEPQSVAGRESLLLEQPVLERRGDEGDPRGDEGPDGLEAGDGLGVALDLLVEREQAVDVKIAWVDVWMIG